MFFVLAIGIGIAFPIFLARRAAILSRQLVYSVIFTAASAVVGAKLFGSIERGWTFGTPTAELVAGYRAPGAVFGAILALSLVPKLFKVGAGDVADLLAPGAAFGIGVLRIGCLLSGCCFGRLCTLPWAIQFPKGSTVWHRHVADEIIDGSSALSGAVHPLQVYLGLWSVLVGVFCLWLLPRRTYFGQVFLAYLFLAGIGKGLLENLRHGYLSHIQYGAFVSAIVAGVLVAWFSSRKPI